MIYHVLYAEDTRQIPVLVELVILIEEANITQTGIQMGF